MSDVTVVWHDDAVDEFRRAKQWYAKIRPELAQRFSMAVVIAVEELTINALH